MTAPDDGLEALLAEHGIARLDIGRNLGQYRTEYECFGCDAKLISDGHRGITPQDAEFAHLAAVVRAAGWVKGREEQWGASGRASPTRTLGGSRMSERDELAAKVQQASTVVGRGIAKVTAWAIANAILAAGYRRPREVTTAAELDALPVGSVVRSSAGTIACKCEATRGVVFGDDRSFPWLKLATPATVLHEPEEGQ